MSSQKTNANWLSTKVTSLVLVSIRLVPCLFAEGCPTSIGWGWGFLLDNSLIKVLVWFCFGLNIGLCASLMYQIYHTGNAGDPHFPIICWTTTWRHNGTKKGDLQWSSQLQPLQHNYHLQSSPLTSMSMWKLTGSCKLQARDATLNDSQWFT